MNYSIFKKINLLIYLIFLFFINMGAGGDVKEENKKLKEKIEKEMKPIIDN